MTQNAAGPLVKRKKLITFNSICRAMKILIYPLPVSAVLISSFSFWNQLLASCTKTRLNEVLTNVAYVETSLLHSELLAVTVRIRLF